MELFSGKHLKLRRTLAIAIACAAFPSTAVRAEDWKFSSSVNYDTGKYGTSDRTNSIYVPFTLKRYYGGADLSVTAPYLRQSSTGQIVWVGGTPVRTARGKATTATSEQSGLGDITVRGTCPLKRNKSKSFDLALAGRIKLPTASKNKGLGTGEFDEGAGLEFSKEVIPGWTMLADGYYTLIGDPPGANFNDQVSLDLGFYRPLRENLSLTVLFETQSAIVDGNAAPRSISGTLSYSVPEGTQFSSGLTLGMSDGSPDIGISAGFSRKF
ncbi:MAG: transporter [Elusimicrobiales bacterium]|jgi:hypothetical protein